MKSKSIMRYGFLGFAVYLVFLIALTPAQFVLNVIPLPDTIRLSGVQGTLWKGSVVKAQINDQVFDNPAWNVSWLSLLMLTPKVHIDSLQNDIIKAQGHLGYSLWSSSVFADHVTAKVDASWLKRQLQLNIPMNVQGIFELDLQRARWQENWVKSISADLAWRDASVTSPMGILDLATPTVTIQDKNNQLLFDIKVNSEALTLDSQTTLNADGRYELKGMLEPKADFPEKMQPALNFIGIPDETGTTFTLSHKGNLFH